MRPDVSVCVATHRRPRGLARLLASLAAQKLPPDVTVEVIVVDNDPGRSAISAAEAAPDFPHALRFLEEPRTNIARARNRAVDEARGEWIAFVDDDEIAHEDWVAEHWRRVEAGDCDGLFGPVEPQLEAVVTPWLDVPTFYAWPAMAPGQPVDSRNAKTGNAFLARHLFEGRRFDPAFGRSGGEDSELFGRMLEGGARFFWCEEAKVSEIVPAERHRLGWLSRRAFAAGANHTRLALQRRDRAEIALRVAGTAPFLIALVLLLPFARLAGRRHAARVWLRACVQAGHLLALAGRRFESYG